MNTAILKMVFISLFLILAGAGCDDDDRNANSEFIEKEFYKFSDFGCENISWHIKPGYTHNHYVISSREELEGYIESDCTPQIDYSKYIVIIGSRSFTTGVSVYAEKVEENSSEIVYTVTFLTNIATVAQSISYHAVIGKSTGNKNVRVVELVIDHD